MQQKWSPDPDDERRGNHNHRVSCTVSGALSPMVGCIKRGRRKLYMCSELNRAEQVADSRLIDEERRVGS
jgi:hypothetical protein